MDLFRHLNPPALSKPTGYTHIVEVQRGRTVYIAGQVAFDASALLLGRVTSKLRRVR
jgi:enamine deaminase RidA (YjgF/YER057c/UK114 family)